MNPHESGSGDPYSASTSYTPSLSSSISNMWTSFARSLSGDATNFPTDRNHAPTHSETSSAFYDLPPLSPVTLSGYKDRIRAESRLLSRALAEEIRILLPERLKLVDEWKLVYSLVQDGASLASMYHRARAFADTRAGFVLVVRDGSGATFGAYLSEHPHPAHSYFGNGECFLWRATLVSDVDASGAISNLPPPPSGNTTNLTARSTTLLDEGDDDVGSTTGTTGTTQPVVDLITGQPLPEPLEKERSARRRDGAGKQSVRFKAFPYSGLNDYFMNCSTAFFSVGAGGGHYGLWLDQGLERGHSAKCDTFGNEPLSEQGEKFYIVNAELWVVSN